MGTWSLWGCRKTTTPRFLSLKHSLWWQKLETQTFSDGTSSNAVGLNIMWGHSSPARYSPQQFLHMVLSLQLDIPLLPPLCRHELNSSPLAFIYAPCLHPCSCRSSIPLTYIFLGGLWTLQNWCHTKQHLLAFKACEAKVNHLEGLPE